MYTPAQGFYFTLGFENSIPDASFMEISGIGIERSTELIEEGGENHLNFTVPGKTKYSPLVLKRGYLPYGSLLGRWCTAVLQSSLLQLIEPRNLSLKLLNPGTGRPVTSWMFYNAYPTKWNLSGFNSTTSDFTIESIEITYTYFGMLNQNTRGLAKTGNALRAREAAIDRQRVIERRQNAVGDIINERGARQKQRLLRIKKQLEQRERLLAKQLGPLINKQKGALKGMAKTRAIAIIRAKIMELKRIRATLKNVNARLRT